jgi:predicted N-formylglutamate amidohydrolase
MVDLIAADEPAPVQVLRASGESPFLLIADHAGNRVPRALSMLGLGQADLDRHIGIDIGILGVGAELSRLLDATLIHQPYSRLVIDCNRLPDRPDAMAPVSDGTRVPGNAALDDAARSARVAAIFTPYHDRIAAEIDRRHAEGRPAVLISLHSFTPRHGDYPAPRPWHVGVLWNRDDRLAQALMAVLRDEYGLVVGQNEPYGVSDLNDYAIPVHAEPRGLIHVELEIRQDLIGAAEGQGEWAARLARALPRAVAALDRAGPAGQAGGEGRGN